MHYSCLNRFTSARLAQSVERKALNLVAVGSSPTVGEWLQQGQGEGLCLLYT